MARSTSAPTADTLTSPRQGTRERFVHYRANDGTTNSNVATVNITVTPPPPTRRRLLSTIRSPFSKMPPPHALLRKVCWPTILIPMPIPDGSPRRSTSTWHGLPQRQRRIHLHAHARVPGKRFVHLSRQRWLDQLERCHGQHYGDATATNAAPVAVNDTLTVQQNASATRTAAQGVLANDSDPDANPLTAALVDQPQHGTVNLSANGGYTYTPTPGYQGAIRSPIAPTMARQLERCHGQHSRGAGQCTVWTSDNRQLYSSRPARDSHRLGSGAPPITALTVDGDIVTPAIPTHRPMATTTGLIQWHRLESRDHARPTGIYTTEQPDEDQIHNLGTWSRLDKLQAKSN